MLRQLRLRARGQGLGAGAGLTQAGAQAAHGTKQSARRPVASAAREARTGAVLSQHAQAEAVSRQCRGDEVGPLHVYAPSMEEAFTSGSSTDDEYLENNAVPATSLAVEPEGKGLSASVSSSEILGPVVADMQQLTVNLRSVVGERHPMLRAAADQIFGAGGKKLRPAICFLVARATCELAGLRNITERHRRLAEITEMIHTASLVHDDVLDDCSVRRGKTTVNSLYGSRVAVLVGDYLFAQSSWYLANLDNLEVIKLISQVIADFANGEISQAASLFDTDITLQQYMDKSFYKTATLIAASCKSAAVFSDVSEEVKNAMFEYGRHLGLAFQVVDDILDFTQTSEQLGKPQGQDLATGNLTAPVVFALSHPHYGAELEGLVQSEFAEEGSLARAFTLVHAAGGMSAARSLARQEADLALEALRCLPACRAKRSLEMMVDYVLDRLY